MTSAPCQSFLVLVLAFLVSNGSRTGGYRNSAI